MFFRKFFVGVLLFCGLNTFADELTVPEKLSYTTEYLCTNVSADLCNMNESYTSLNDYHKILLRQVNNKNLSVMEETLPANIQEALNDLENVTDVYNMRQILLTGIKFSKYFDKSVAFYDSALSKLNVAMDQDDIWQSSITDYERSVKEYDEAYIDPYRDAVVSWAELGRDFVDSAKQMKASADAAISISKATFLYPYVKSIETTLKYIDTIDNIEAGYKVATELLPMLKDLVPKLYDSTYTHNDLLDLLDKCNDIMASFDDNYGDSKPSKVIAVIAQISKFIAITEQEAAFAQLYPVYKDNVFTKQTLNILRNVLDSKMMISVIDTIKILNGLLPSGTGNVDDFIDVSNNLVKAFADYELKLRRVLHKVSLNDEYLKLYIQRTSISKHLYAQFMFGYFRKHTSDIVDIKAFKLDAIPEEQENETPPTLKITLPQNATLDGYKLTATQGDTISFQGGITAGFLRGCIHDAGGSATYTLWYIDSDNKRKSLALDFDSFNQTFSFAMPSTQITMVDLAYDKNIADDPYGSGFCGLPEVWESVVDANGTTESNETVNLANGLVAHYEFEGDANDSSGNGNNGTEYGGVSYVDGVIGQAGSFDGVDDWIKVINSSSINTSTTSLSLSTWVNWNGTTTSMSYIIDKFSNKFNFALNGNDMSSGKPRFVVMNTEGINDAFNAINTHSWYYLTGTYSNNISKLYINGILINTESMSRIIESSGDITIGCYENCTEDYAFNGLIDDLRIYNRALNEAEIKELYKLGQPINLSDGLVAHYEFEGDANDSSGNGNDGVEYGGVSYVNGVIGQAGSFDGLDDYIEVSNSPTFPQNAITMSYWIKRNSIPLSLDNYISKELAFQSYLKNNAYLESGFWKGTPGNWSGYSVDSNINNNLNNWILYSITFDNNTKIAKSFINGVLIHTTVETDVNAFVRESTNPMFIGKNGSADAYYINSELDDLRIYDRVLSEVEIKELYNLGSGITTIQTINLLNETHQDGTIIIDSFSKEWTFNKNLTDLNITILENSYQNTITSSDFTKDGTTLKVNLIPNTSSAINKLVLQFRNSNGNIVKVSGSQTFWSLTKTNHAPRLADGQITKLVGDSSATLDIETYDSDGDSVTLSVEESAGGSVSLNGNRLSASFSDGKVVHTIKIGLNDGKEKVVKEFRVIDFSQNSIENYYVDVTTGSEYFDAIAFGTLKGVVEGQVNPSNETQRIFRPDDNVSLAEALKIVINAEQKAGLVALKTAEYYRRTFPMWAMPYYTFAVDSRALESEMGNLAFIYPSRESIAMLIVKTLDLEAKVHHLDSNVSFADEADFSDATMLHYATLC